MNAYLWANLILCALSVVGGLIWLSNGIAQRTRESVAGNVAFNAALMLWAVYLLSRG
ncbi:hypothetical protein D3C86_2135300 [compost metagenome]